MTNPSLQTLRAASAALDAKNPKGQAVTATTDANGGIGPLQAGDGTLCRIEAFDTKGRPDRIFANGDTYSLAYDASGNLTKVGKPAPWLFATTEGPTQFAHNSNIRGACVGFGGKIYAISAVDRKCYVYESGAWAVKSAAIDAGAGIFQVLLADSRGYLFCSWGPSAHAGAQKLYRSTDGGATWSVVIDATFMPDGDDLLGSMTEADNGYLFASVYNDVDLAGTAARELLRSTDGGATWASIATAALAATNYTRHFHSVYFCPHRLALFVTGGDTGATAKIIVSTDYGVTFTPWAASFQATAVTSDADYVYFFSDVDGDRSIYRAAGETAAAIVASTPYRTFTAGTSFTPNSPITNCNGSEFAWWGRVDAEGSVIFPAGKGARAALLISGDQGASWVDGLNGAAAGTTQWAYEPHFCSLYNTAWDGYFYGSINGAGYTRRWRVYKSPTVLTVDSASGDDVIGDGVSRPFATIPEAGIKANAVIALTSNYTKNASLGLSGLILHRNGYALGVAESGTLTINETFEGTSSLTTSVTGSGTASQVDTTQPKLGTRCARVTTSGAGTDTAMVQKGNVLSGVAQGAEVWLAGWFNLTAASLTANAILMQLQTSLNIMVDTTANGGGLMVQSASNSHIYRQHADDYTALILNGWNYLKAKIRYHATSGSVTLWANGKRVLHATGINTYNAGALHARFGLYSSQAITADIDNVKISFGFDPDQPPALVLNGTGQLVIPDMLTTQGVKTW